MGWRPRRRLSPRREDVRLLLPGRSTERELHQDSRGRGPRPRGHSDRLTTTRRLRALTCPRSKGSLTPSTVESLPFGCPWPMPRPGELPASGQFARAFPLSPPGTVPNRTVPGSGGGPYFQEIAHVRLI